MLIFWDFNGTILDDVDLSLDIAAGLFAQSGRTFPAKEEYLARFRFPVREYYREIGIESEEEYQRISQVWADEYVRRCSECALQPGVAETVRAFHERGWHQVILSASQQDVLRGQVSSYPELNGMFDEVIGLRTVYGDSKVSLAKDYCRRHQVEPEKCVFFGDTDHDAETADAIGCRCILIAAGHQNAEVLRATGKTVVLSVREAAALLDAEAKQ